MELELQNMLEIARLKAHPNTQLPQVSLKKMFCFFLWHMFLDTLRSSMLKFFLFFSGVPTFPTSKHHSEIVQCLSLQEGVSENSGCLNL